MNQNNNENSSLSDIDNEIIDYRGYEGRARELRAEAFLAAIKTTDFQFFGKFYSWAKKLTGKLLTATGSNNRNLKIDADCIRNPATC